MIYLLLCPLLVFVVLFVLSQVTNVSQMTDSSAPFTKADRFHLLTLREADRSTRSSDPKFDPSILRRRRALVWRVLSATQIDIIEWRRRHG